MAYARQSDPGGTGTSSASAETKSAQCEPVCAVKHRSQNPASALAWEQELNRCQQQCTRVRAIEDKASNEAKDFLTAEPQEKLKELAKPESMMQCMRPTQRAEATDGQVGHHVSSAAQKFKKAEKAHSSH